MNNRPIGVFDSGLGGLTAVKQLHRLLPHESIVYFGDTGRVPYGSRSRALLRQYARQDMEFLLRHHVKMVIAACGTVSSTASDIGDALPVPFTGTVNPSAEAAVRASRSGRIGVIATAATIASHAFRDRILALRPDAVVTQQACPLLVPLVEGGFTAPDEPVTRMVLERYLAPMRDAQVDTLILACTHYPIIAPAIAQVMGSGVALIDSGAAAAQWTADLLDRMNLRADRTEKGATEYYVTDLVQGFAQIGSIVLGEALPDVSHVDVSAL